MFTKTFFRISMVCLLLALMVLPTFGMSAAPLGYAVTDSQTTLQLGLSRPTLPGIACDPGTGGSGGGCGGG
jgi:hypothetical protein